MSQGPWDYEFVAKAPIARRAEEKIALMRFE